MNTLSECTDLLNSNSADDLRELESQGFDVSAILSANYAQTHVEVPVGIAGPLLLDGHLYHVPIATTEGCLTASINRGMTAIRGSSGAKSVVHSDYLIIDPIIRVGDMNERCRIEQWLKSHDTLDIFHQLYRSMDVSQQVKILLFDMEPRVIGDLVFIFLKATINRLTDQCHYDKLTDELIGDIVCEIVTGLIEKTFASAEIISDTNTYVPSPASSWIRPRGMNVSCECKFPPSVVFSVLKCSPQEIVDLWMSKIMTGSAMAGIIGGSNSHAANIVNAIYIATGQPIASSIVSSNCIIQMKLDPDGSLYAYCTMPSIRCDVGTDISGQKACLAILGVNSSSHNQNELLGRDDRRFLLARILCGSVLAGELSLLAALAKGVLVRAHMSHNRSHINVIDSEKKTEELMRHNTCHSG